MLDLWTSGLLSALEPYHLGMLVAGTVFGMILGVIPGIGPVQGLAILLPLTFALDPVASIVMLGGVYSGGLYGGQISSILIGTPGDPAHAMTVLDGYPMTKRGEGGVAIGAATAASFGSAFAGLFALSFAAPAFARVAIRFGPPEFFLLSMGGLLLISVALGSNPLKGFVSAGVGMLLSFIGFSPILGVPRFTFGLTAIGGGISFIALTIGLFAIAEVIELAGRTKSISRTGKLSGGVLEGMRALWTYKGTAMRATGIGLGLGGLPGVGAATANMIAYLAAARTSREPESFGHGSVEGVIASEASNNSVIGTSLIPTLTLGIPGSATAALLLGALTIQGVFPGPRLFQQSAGLVYTFFVSLFLAQIIWLIIGLSLTNTFARLSMVRLDILVPLLVAVSFLAVYVERRATGDVLVALAIGVFGYGLRRSGYSPVPLLIAFILTPLAEESYHQTMRMSDGSWTIFATRTYSVSLLLLAALGYAAYLASSSRRGRRRRRELSQAGSINDESYD